MPRAVGLMNPDNAAKSAGSFKEGFVRIDSNSYKVHASKGGDDGPPIPATKWSWKVTRLAENGEDPLLNEHDEPITEELLFSFGGKCLPFVHPGKADGPDDDEPEDLGTSAPDADGKGGAEGNTIYLVAPDWRPNEKSGLMVLTASLIAQSVKSEFLNRCWAPDWNGCIFEVKTKATEKDRDGKSFNMKIVTRVLVGPGKSKGGTKASSNGKSENAETILAPILMSLSNDLDGQRLTEKAFANRVKSSMDATKVDSKFLIPVLSLCKDRKWLAEHASTFDFTLNEDHTIQFGSSS